VRVAVVSESFLPAVNGVTNSVLRVLEQFQRTGHRALVIAPGPGPGRYAEAEVIRMPSVPLPRYRSFPLGLPSPRIEAILDAFAPDVVHLASPFALGAHAAAAARRLGLPSVAAYQTDVAGWLSSYRLAREKRVSQLAALAGLPGCRLVVVGDGPLRGQLEASLPWARFLGMRTGPELSSIFASLDVFIRTRPSGDRAGGGGQRRGGAARRGRVRPGGRASSTRRPCRARCSPTACGS
jgi:hypothetical protein